jgi:glutamate dehydrogenase/leucine dehydrogenase
MQVQELSDCQLISANDVGSKYKTAQTIRTDMCKPKKTKNTHTGKPPEEKGGEPRRKETNERAETKSKKKIDPSEYFKTDLYLEH